MNKLLSANLMRLRKNKCFLVSLFLMLCAGIVVPLNYYFEMKGSGGIYHLENGFFSCSFCIVILLSLFSSLFIGTEYNDGTVRNKMIVGHKRRDIYLANLFTNMMVGVFLYAAYFTVYLCVGVPLLGFFQANIKVILLFVVIMILFTFAFSALFTMVAMLLSNKAGAVAACILGTVLLIIVGIYIYGRLSAPKMIPMYSLDINGAVEEKMEENHGYLEGTEREVYQFLSDFLPGGQAIQCASMEAKNPYRLPVYSAVMFVLVTSAGIFLFSRKDIQ